MKNYSSFLKTAFLIGLFVLSASLAEAQKFTLTGRIETNLDYDIVLYQVDDFWEKTDTITIPFRNGMFGSKDYFKLMGFEKRKYIMEFVNCQFKKTVYLDLTELNRKFHLELIGDSIDRYTLLKYNGELEDVQVFYKKPESYGSTNIDSNTP